ncbi:MAG: hypothetical protein IPK26_28175 [Planctomycetes bacterium]|nr:hypothetical protein [Planctomycetota bacterium]
MLANPIIIPAYADPFLWTVALLAMWAEVETEARLLRRFGWIAGVVPRLLLINVATWLVFLCVLAWLSGRGLLYRPWPAVAGVIAGLEGCIVLVEAVLLRLMIRRADVQGTRIPLRQAATASLLGNLVSIAASLVPVATIWLLS